MKKLLVLSTFAALTATGALAGGYAAPVIEAEPVVVEEAARGSSGFLLPAILAAVVIAAIASSDSSGTTDSPS